LLAGPVPQSRSAYSSGHGRNFRLHLKTKSLILFFNMLQTIPDNSRIRLMTVLGLIFAFRGLSDAQSGAVELNHSLRLRFGLSDPLSPESFRKYWKTGLGVDISYQASATEHLEFTAGAGYTVFGLNGPQLSREFNRSAAASTSYAFDEGAFRLGLFHTGLNIHFGSIWKPLSYFIRAEGVLALAHQEDAVLTQSFGGHTVRRRLILGGDETAAGAVAAIGAKIRIERRFFIVLSADGCVLRTSDRVGGSDLVVADFSRAQGEPTAFTTFRAGLDVQY
jgi:hypothetical protein